MTNREISQVLKTYPLGLYGGNLYDDKEIAAASRVIFNQSPFRFYGLRCTNEADNFEKECCDYFGVRHAHTTNSGLGALMAALHALDVGPGDEVIVPGYFWIADTNVVILRGAMPVMCEVDETLNLDPKDLVKKITPRTKCVIAIHMTGAQADIDEIMRICKPRGITVIEDLSQCVGGSVNSRKLGSIGDIGIASLQLNKLITSGEGGLLLTNSDDYYLKITARTDLGYPRVGGISQNTGDDTFTTYGEGRRFSEISAAIMREQLKKLPGMLTTLRATKKRIKDHLKARGGLQFRTIVEEAGEAASVLTIIFDTTDARVRFQKSVKELFPSGEMRLAAVVDMGLHIYYNCSNLVKKIPALPGGFPWNLPENAGHYCYDKGTLPQTDSIVERAMHVNLPPNLNAVQVDAMIAAFDAVLDQVHGRAGASSHVVDAMVHEPALVA